MAYFQISGDGPPLADAGFKAMLAALNAAQIFVTGFSNARQTARHARQLMACKSYRTINVIASHALDDDGFSCAEYIRDHILGLRQIEPRDLDICTREVKSDFVMGVDGSLQAPRIIKRRGVELG